MEKLEREKHLSEEESAAHLNCGEERRSAWQDEQNKVWLSRKQSDSFYSDSFRRSMLSSLTDTWRTPFLFHLTKHFMVHLQTPKPTQTTLQGTISLTSTNISECNVLKALLCVPTSWSSSCFFFLQSHLPHHTNSSFCIKQLDMLQPLYMQMMWFSFSLIQFSPFRISKHWLTVIPDDLNSQVVKEQHCGVSSIFHAIYIFCKYEKKKKLGKQRLFVVTVTLVFAHTYFLEKESEMLTWWYALISYLPEMFQRVSLDLFVAVIWTARSAEC